MWIITRRSRDSWQFHSAHVEKTTAEEWIRCLMHQAEGEYQLLAMTKDDCNDLADAFSTMGVE